MTLATVETTKATKKSSTYISENKKSLKNDSLKLGDNISFIEKLIIEQEVWQDTAFKTSNDMLYTLLAKCYAKYEEMCADNDVGKKLRDELNTHITMRGVSVNKNSHTLIKIVKCVFGDNKRRVSAYSIVLRSALANKIKSSELADFICQNGGVEEIRLAKNGNVLSAKQKAEAAKSAVVSNSLAEFTSEEIAQQLDAANIGEQILFVATQQADGKFTINAVSTNATAVNTALAAYYSANKNSIKDKQDVQNTATTDEQLTNIINSHNA